MHRDRRLRGPGFESGTVLVAVSQQPTYFGSTRKRGFRHKGSHTAGQQWPKGSSETIAIFEEKEEEDLLSLS